MKIRDYKNGYATMERTAMSYYIVKCYTGTELHDKIMCDTYRAALDYFKAFSKIAKQA